MNKKQKIRITGAGGYLGTLLFEELVKHGHEVSGISRSRLFGTPEQLKKDLAGTETLINLAGATILQRWTKKNKTDIYNSRILTTQNVVQAIQQLPENLQPKKFISASAIGIYKNGEYHTEDSYNLDNGFVGKVVKDWEDALNMLPQTIQNVIFRIAPVIGKEAQLIKKLLLPFKFGLGATIGNGKQAFPYIHEKDIVNAFLWAVEEAKQSALYNLASPENITNKEFTNILAKALHRPAIFSIPEFVFKVMFGEAATMITKSPSVSSEKIIQAGFKFTYPELKGAINEIIK